MIKKFCEFILTKMVRGQFFGSILTMIQKICEFIIRVVRGICRAVLYIPDLLLKKLSHHIIVWTTKIEDDKVVFLTYQGDYTCNPKGIADEMIKEDLPLKIYWAVKGDVTSTFPLNIDFVKRGTYDFYKLVASAKIVVDNTNTLQRMGVVKKRGQYFIQTWHGSLGIKRLDGDVVMNRQWRHLKRLCKKQTDYLISNSDFETEVFHTSYWPGVEILPYGHARNDIFFKTDEHEEIKEKV
ncbi:MAG: CDP-glycerol glycerophosphotransferase family protein, partial [Acutalibacteraceae bacterium]